LYFSFLLLGWYTFLYLFLFFVLGLQSSIDIRLFFQKKGWLTAGTSFISWNIHNLLETFSHPFHILSTNLPKEEKETAADLSFFYKHTAAEG